MGSLETHCTQGVFCSYNTEVPIKDNITSNPKPIRIKSIEKGTIMCGWLAKTPLDKEILFNF